MATLFIVVFDVHVIRSCDQFPQRGRMSQLQVIQMTDPPLELASKSSALGKRRRRLLDIQSLVTTDLRQCRRGPE